MNLVTAAFLAGWLGFTAGPSTAREIWVPLAGPKSVITEQLIAADLTVRLDQVTQTIRKLHQAGAIEPAWKVVIYFDAPLATPDGLRKAGQWLSHQADSLSRLGATEIVLADPLPYRLLEATRDPLALRDALRHLPNVTTTTGELMWQRQRFSTHENEGDDGYVARALRHETELIEQQRMGLLAWLTRNRSLGPNLLILVQNGYDLNPRTFYTGEGAGTFLEDPRTSFSQESLTQAVAVEGWTVICLALGPRPAEFSNPIAPLFEIARATGGDVVTSRRDGAHLLDEVVGWPILVVELAAEPGPGALPFEVVASNTQQRLKTRAWASAAPLPGLAEVLSVAALPSAPASPVVQLLRPEGLTLEGEVRFRTITSGRRVERVVFHLDGQIVAETDKKPFSAVIDLGPGVRPHTIGVAAYSRSDHKLGEDSLQLNMALEPPRVTIATLDYNTEKGVLEVSATATEPSGLRPDRVEIHLNDGRAATILEPPFEARIATKKLGPADVVRVLAYYPTGETAEAAGLPATRGTIDELDVNLVELLAIVTSRDRGVAVELERSDFVIRQQGRSLPIDQFSRWDELQLTLGLVLDTSDSMDEILEDAREAGELFFEQALRVGDEAFVVNFNTYPRLARRVTSDFDGLLDSLVGLEARGYTALYDAIVFSLQQFENTSGRRALVVVTDGSDSASHYQPPECVRQARLHGVPIYTIVLGRGPHFRRTTRGGLEMLRNQMIARRTGGEVYFVSDLDDLGRIYDQIVDELRRQYFLAFSASHTLTPEELEGIEIDVIPEGLSVRMLLASQQRGG